MSETAKTAGFVVVAAALAVGAALLQPERRTPSILSDQGEIFYPEFKDPRVVKTIEVVDYDESTATARPFKIEQQRGRWIIPSHYSYPVDAGAKLAAIAAGLMNLRKDQVVSDSVQDHVRYGVVDPLDAKTASLQGRGKRVTLRDAGKATVADFILGRKVEGKDGYRYVRLPGQKRVYAVKTDADPSAQFSDWVNSAILRIPAASIRKISILSYSVDERLGGLTNLENVVLTQEGGEWKMAGGAPNPNAVRGLTSTLENLKIVDVKPKPPSLAQGLRDGRIELSLETALSLRQRGFHLAPNGRILANEGEMTVESTGGLAYVLRFGEIATGENRYLFATVSCRGGDGGAGCESQARDLNARFAEWYYVISGADFQRLRLRKKDLAR